MAVAEVDAATIVVGMDVAVNVGTVVEVSTVVDAVTAVDVGTVVVEINDSDVVGIVTATRGLLSDECTTPVGGGGGGSESTLDAVVASITAAVDFFLDKLGDIFTGGRGSEFALNLTVVSTVADFDCFFGKLGDNFIAGGGCRLATTNLGTMTVFLVVTFVFLSCTADCLPIAVVVVADFLDCDGLGDPSCLLGLRGEELLFRGGGDLSTAADRSLVDTDNRLLAITGRCRRLGVIRGSDNCRLRGLDDDDDDDGMGTRDRPFSRVLNP